MSVRIIRAVGCMLSGTTAAALEVFEQVLLSGPHPDSRNGPLPTGITGGEQLDSLGGVRRREEIADAELEEAPPHENREGEGRVDRHLSTARKVPQTRASSLDWKAPPIRRLLLAAFVLAGLSAVIVDLAGAEYSHAPLQVLEGKFKVGEDAELRPLGELSAYCLGCHPQGAESVAEEPDVAVAPGPAHSVGVPDRTHPVDVLYPDGAQGYVPAQDLDVRLTLVEGRLTCGSCHDLAAPDRRVVLPLEQSQLCTACHVA